MKKALAILACLTLTTSGFSNLISCQANQKNQDETNLDSQFKVNDLNNLVGAIGSEAKAIIIDNEFGISQDVSKKILDRLYARDVITDYNPEDPGLSSSSLMSSVLRLYLEPNQNHYQELDSENVSLGNLKGAKSGLSTLIPQKYLDLIPEELKEFLKKVLEEQKKNLTGENLIKFFNEANEDRFTGVIGLIISFLKNWPDLGFKNFIDGFKPWLPVVQAFFESLITNNEVLQQIYSLNNELFNPEKASYLEKTIYEAQPDSGILTVGDIPLTRVKNEITLSVTRILKLVYDIPEETDPAFSGIQPGTDQETSLILGSLFVKLISQESWPVHLTAESYPLLGQEIVRIVTILNAYFSFFEDSKTFVPENSQHLFSTDLNNYEYLSQVAGGKTLGDIAYVQDKAFNLSYFLMTLDYYFGSLNKLTELSAYRFEQLIFLILNDPVENYQDRRGYQNKSSLLTNQLFDTLLVMGAKITTGAGKDSILTIFNDDAGKQATINTILKPFLLGFANGDDLTISLSLVKGLIGGITNIVPELIFLKDYLDDFSSFLDQVKQFYVTDTLHHFLRDDMRKLFVNMKVLNETLLNRWFNYNQVVNLQTMFNQPLSKVFEVFEVNLSNKKSPLGETFLNQSAPQLVHLLGTYFNNFNKDLTLEEMKYNNADDPLTSLKTLNLNLPVLHQLINTIFGNENGQDNVFWRICSFLLSDGDNDTVRGTGLNFQAVVRNLGLTATDEFEATSFLGLAIQTFLPLTQSQTTSPIKISADSYGIDLFGLWLTNLVDVLEKLDTVGNYDAVVKQLINISNTFTIKLKQDELRYFTKNRRQIWRVAVIVEFINPMSLKQTNYVFRAQRDEPEKQFRLVKITSDKLEGGN